MNKEYKEYLQSKEWRLIKKQLYKLRGKKCEKCRSTKNIHVHHLTYNNIFREFLSDLQLLCENCHKKVHNKKPLLKNPKSRKKKRRMVGKTQLTKRDWKLHIRYQNLKYAGIGIRE